MWNCLAFLLPLCLIDVQLIGAVKIPFRVQYTKSNSLSRRGSIFVANTLNAEYISNITLGGRTVPVLLDTGSSDLWVAGDVPSTNDLGTFQKLSYAVGTAAGNINVANFSLGSYTVNDQAYVLVQNTSTFSVDILSQGFSGLMGLGPNSGSKIHSKINDATSDSVLTRIFSANNFASNYITFLLNRQNDHAQHLSGQLTIAEILPQFANISSMRNLTVEKVRKLTQADQHWQIFTDANGVVGPDGQPINVHSFVPSAPKNQLVAVIDSGYTLPQVPRTMSDAIYGRVPGAVYDTTNGYWTVPCDSLVNLTFIFGGVEIFIHPLDVVMSEFGYTDANGNTACVGSFQPITSAFSLFGEYDIILGMAFLRNTYTYIDFGNFVPGKSRSNPFVRLLPITDREAAHTDFVNVRMNGVDVSGDPAHALLPLSQGKTSPVSSQEIQQQYEARILSHWPYVIGGGVVLVLIIVSFCTWRCCNRRKAAKAKKMRAKNQLQQGGDKSFIYLPLQTPYSSTTSVNEVGKIDHFSPR